MLHILIGLFLLAIFYVLMFGLGKETIKGKIEYHKLSIIVCVILPAFYIMLLVSGWESKTEYRIYKDQLKGKENPYEMIIRYELRDSVVFPVDTMFKLKDIK